MRSTDAGTASSKEMAEVSTIDMALEVVTVPVSDVERAKALLSEPGLAAGRRLLGGQRRPVGADDAAPLAVLDPLREGRPGHHGDGAWLPSEGVPGGQGHRRRSRRSRQPR